MESTVYGRLKAHRGKIKTGGESHKGSTSRGGWGDYRKDSAEAVPRPECSSNPAFNRRCHVGTGLAQGKKRVNFNRVLLSACPGAARKPGIAPPAKQPTVACLARIQQLLYSSRLTSFSHFAMFLPWITELTLEATSDSRHKRLSEQS